MLDTWAEGFALDDDFGDAIRSCRKRHLAEVVDDCFLTAHVMMETDDRSTGRVSYATIVPRSEQVSSECVQLAQCVRDAWKNRPAPWPAGHAADRIAFSVNMYTPPVNGLDRQGMLAQYEKVLSESQGMLLDAEKMIEEHGPVPGLLHNRARSEAVVRDTQRMIEELR